METEKQIEREQILAGLRPLIEQARRERKWLWCHYQDLWFSPDRLEAEHAKGSFIWGATNWKLRDPQERVSEAEKRARSAAAEVARIKAEVAEK